MPNAAAPTSPTANTLTLRVHNLHKTYRLGRVNVPVLRGASINVREGEFIAILGASGSGKSTLLHLIGGLDRPDRAPESSKGEIEFEGQLLSKFSTRRLDDYRAREVGFVFQFYHLLPELSVLQNVLIAGMVRHGLGFPRIAASTREHALELLETLGLGHRVKHRPAELSGGERQRVAIARALINRPKLLLADEPTGNLDRTTGQKILDALLKIRHERRQTMVVVTHDESTAARADSVVRLEDGRVVSGR
jgi:lipoprotein-releasing system ATP-binding protein